MSKETTSPRKRSPKEAHKRDFIWQILLPMILTFLVFIVISISIAMQPTATTPKLAAISVIWLIIPWIVVALVALAIIIAMIYGMAKLMGIAPTYTKKLHGAIDLVKEKAEQVADASAKPIFFTEGIAASFRNIFHKNKGV